MEKTPIIPNSSTEFDIEFMTKKLNSVCLDFRTNFQGIGMDGKVFFKVLRSLLNFMQFQVLRRASFLICTMESWKLVAEILFGE